jgi:hypothetical protein
MRTTTVICLLLAALLCAAALQTSESEALSPTDISEIVQSAEAESPVGARNAVILTSDEEPSSDLEDAEDEEEEAPEETQCATMGVFAPLVGIVGSMQAAEALKLLCGTGESLAGRLLMLDALHMRWSEIGTRRAPGCKVCGTRPGAH